MKKAIILFAALAAAMTFSCTKETLEEIQNETQVSKGGFPVSIMVGSPATGNGEEEADETKVIGSPKYTSEKLSGYGFQWEKGDSIVLLAYDPTPKSKTEASPIENYIMKCGTLYAQSSGEKVWFAGEIDAELANHPNCTGLYAMANPGNFNFTFGFKDAATTTKPTSYTVYGLTIPKTQDGTGFKSSFYLSTGWKMEFVDNVPTIKTVGDFTLGNSILSLDLSELNKSVEIDSILVNFYYIKVNTGAETTFYPTGEFNVKTNSLGINGSGKSNQFTNIVIKDSNNGALSDTVYFAMRRTFNSTDYNAPTLFMYFYYKEKGDTVQRYAAKKLVLGENGKYSKTYNVLDGNVTILPKISSLAVTPKISWTASADADIVPVDTAVVFPYFPWSSDLNKGKNSTVGMSDDEIAAFYVPNKDHQYIFKNNAEAQGDTLIIGTTSNNKPEYRHYFTNSMLRMRCTYIEIPAIPGKKFYRIEATTSTNPKSTNGEFTVSKSKGSSSYLSPEVYNVYMNSTTPVDRMVTNSNVNTKYYMIVGGGGKYITSFKFYYL